MVAKIPTRHRAARILSQGGLFTSEHPRIASRFEESAQVVLYQGDALDLLRSLPSRMVRLVVTSPPYNIGKPYERKIRLDVYLEQQKRVIAQAVRILADNGSICWQVGNYVNENEIVPLDIALYPIFKGLGLKLRNRIIWHFEHVLHCSRRLSGRHETILWFTKSNEYVLNLDAIRVPQKYPFKKAFNLKPGVIRELMTRERVFNATVCEAGVRACWKPGRPCTSHFSRSTGASVV